jgi:hypothetical protein
MAARNMQRIEINIPEKELCVKFVIYNNCTEMLHGQLNIKLCIILCCTVHLLCNYITYVKFNTNLLHNAFTC